GAEGRARRSSETPRGRVTRRGSGALPLEPRSQPRDLALERLDAREEVGRRRREGLRLRRARRVVGIGGRRRVGRPRLGPARGRGALGRRRGRAEEVRVAADALARTPAEGAHVGGGARGGPGRAAPWRLAGG